MRHAKREDIVILVFHAWLLFVSVWTVLNESIPHLVVALAAHILGTTWAGVRIQTAKDWYSMYRRHVMFGSCDGVDVFGDWWDLRARNATPVVFINAMTTFAFAYLTIAIFRTYMKHTVTRAGAPKVVQRVYKLVALFSASLHLATFFNLASAAIWLSKITVGRLKDVSDHIELYLGLVIVGLVLEFPWILIGWICVRKECYIRFWLFVVIGTIPFVFATVLFASQIYGFIFHTWPFFATITITSYIFTITTLITGVICRTQFGKGLAHFLQVEAALASLDFTPANLSSDLEKAGTRSEIISFSGMPAFPDSPSETKHLRAVPSLSAISSKHRSVLPSDNLSLRTSSIFTVPVNRRQSGQTVLDLLELPAARTRSPSFRFTRTLSKQPSIQESIISTTTTNTNGNTNAPSPLSKNTFDIVETAPVLAPITPVSSFRVLPPHRTPSNLSVITSVPPTSLRAPRDRSPLSSSDSASTRSGNSPSRPPGLGLPTRPSEAVRPALSRRPRTPPESDSPSIPLPPLPLSRTDV
ncbi:hypothetical protein ONZ45_g18750 [Pleurotus djamor]|nr:hypothetical protein ONZ45_g18750 [Pleurotus djamor]